MARVGMKKREDKRREDGGIGRETGPTDQTGFRKALESIRSCLLDRHRGLR